MGFGIYSNKYGNPAGQYSLESDPLDLPTLEERLKCAESHSVDLPALGEPVGVSSIHGMEPQLGPYGK